MHEYSIVQALLDRVEAEAKARNATAIHRLYVRIGEMSGVEASLLATAFQLFREKTLCEGTELEIESVPVRWECRSCGKAIPRGAVLRCVGCGGEARLLEGDEIVLSRIEMEVP
jgi:hydrogenase nickel incorporation protein HypA/HybF